MRGCQPSDKKYQRVVRLFSKVDERERTWLITGYFLTLSCGQQNWASVEEWGDATTTKEKYCHYRT
jgi:hypothetical protein